MQTQLAPRARRLLVAAGVITVGLTALAPAAMAAQPDHEVPEHSVGNGIGQGGGAGRSGAAGAGAGAGVGVGVGRGGLDKVTVCHGTSSETEPSVVIEVSEHAVERGHDHDHDDQVVDGGGEELGCDGLETAGAGGNGQGNGNNGGGNNGNGGNNGGGNNGDGGNNGGGNGGDNSGNGGGGAVSPTGSTPEVLTEVPTPPVGDGAPTAPAPPAGDPRPPLPVQISADTAVPDGPEVLGAVTTRTPTGDTTVAGLTSLPRTGTDSVRLLGLLGGMLVLAGVGLERFARRSSPLAGARQG